MVSALLPRPQRHQLRLPANQFSVVLSVPSLQLTLQDARQSHHLIQPLSHRPLGISVLPASVRRMTNVQLEQRGQSSRHPLDSNFGVQTQA